MADAPRSFRQATTGGNPPGRPRTAQSPYQFAGSQQELNGRAQAVIAAERWRTSAAGAAFRAGEDGAWREAMQAWYDGGRDGAPPVRKQRSAQSAADRSAAVGQWNRERELPNQRGFYNPDSAAAGGSGSSPKNPWY